MQDIRRVHASETETIVDQLLVTVKWFDSPISRTSAPGVAGNAVTILHLDSIKYYHPLTNNSCHLD